MDIAFREENRKEIVNMLKQFGYNYVTIDLEGYRTGSMNEKFRVRKLSSDGF